MWALQQRQVSSPKRGYTLLELILSLAIAVLLMAGLYLAVSIQLDHAQAGREVVDENTLTRSLFQRMGSDIERCLGPMDPSRSGLTDPQATETDDDSNDLLDNSKISFNLGMTGDAQTLTLYTCKPQRGGNAPTDIRQVVYYVGNEEGASGLLRREVPMTQADDGSGTMLNGLGDDVDFKVLAEEIEEVQFRYYDSEKGWVQDWPVDATGFDGITSIGPPIAVEIVLKVRSSSRKITEARAYRHVALVPTANGPSLQSLGLKQPTTTEMP